MKTLTLILAFAAVATAQKSLKAIKVKPQYIATSPGAGGLVPEAAPQSYQAGPPRASISNHGYGGGASPNYASGIGGGLGKASANKPNFPLLLSDTRTLNTDGTINFNYQADNGLQQGETVDADGTRRGFYSYPGADGKVITVKYTAGKNGFVAEGDHLPTQPQAAPYNPKQEQDDLYSSGKKGSYHGGLGGGLSSGLGSGGHYNHHAAPVHHGGHHGGAAAYRPSGHHNANLYSHSTGAHLGQGQRGAAAFANFPDFSSHYSGVGGSPSYSTGGAGRFGGAGAQVGAHPGGSSSFASLQALGSQGGHRGAGAGLADLSNIGSSIGSAYSGPMFTVNNPYQPAHTGPVNAGFDLGNGGHFSINFTPGTGTEYNPNELSGDYNPHSHHGGSAGVAGHHGASQGR